MYLKMASYTIPELDIEYMNLIICLKSVELVYSLPSDKCLVTAIARELSLDSQQITVSFEDNYIELGLTAIDCCIVENSRLIVAIIKKIHVDAVFKYLLRDGCICRTDADGGYRPPPGTLSKCIISCSHNNTENTSYVGVDVFTGDEINNRAPYVRYYTPYSARSSGLSLGPPNIMDLENDIKLKTFLENNEANLSWDSWNERYELEHVL